MAQVVEVLPGKSKVLRSNPSPAPPWKKKKERERENLYQLDVRMKKTMSVRCSVTTWPTENIQEELVVISSVNR
jgi:hypothetical protein